MYEVLACTTIDRKRTYYLVLNQLAFPLTTQQFNVHILYISFNRTIQSVGRVTTGVTGLE